MVICEPLDLRPPLLQPLDSGVDVRWDDLHGSIYVYGVVGGRQCGSATEC